MMPSLIPGFEYDIFISYRHKDNKGAHWVRDFDDALKTELEATFKEDISIYFDENPHDGLLETHNVDKSLEGKLECLIFIPIVSQTYCDAKSFAWQHELCAFNKLAKEDQFGRDIKLVNGNVASRILPIKIHDLDAEDKALLASELGGVLRAIEFIFKSAGVNRPLRPHEDHPHDNLNKTFYRDQINKVANAIKEIIIAMKSMALNGDHRSERVSPGSQTHARSNEHLPVKQKSSVKKWLLFMLVCILGGVGSYSYFHKKDVIVSDAEKYIAVLPLHNLSADPNNQFFADGIVEDLLNRLSTIEGFKVISRTSSERYRERNEKSLPQIAKELGVSYIIEGSVQRDSNKTRINIQLIDAHLDAHIWSKYFDRDFKDIFKIQSEIAIDIAHELNTVLTPQQTTDIQRNRTENIKAYELYQLGRFYWNKRTINGYQTGIGYFEKAIAEDPNYGLAYSGLADTYNLMALQEFMDLKTGRDKAVTLALKALELDDRLAEAHTVLGSIYTNVDWSWEAAEKEYRMALDLNPNFSTVHHYYSEHLSIVGKHEEARKHINKALELDPLSFVIRHVSAKLYFGRGQFHEALAENQRCNELNKDHRWPAFYDFIINKYLDNGPEALAGFKRYASIIGVTDPSKADSIYQTSGLNGLIRWGVEFSDSPIHKSEWYAYLGENEKALEMLEKAFQKQQFNAEFAFYYAFRDLYSTPRFNKILEQMNLPVHLPAP